MLSRPALAPGLIPTLSRTAAPGAPAWITLLAKGSSAAVTNISGARFVSRYHARIVEQLRA